MANIDKSRSIFDPRKHYTGVQQQQGRVVTDFDHNDAARIAADERQHSNLDVIGGYGSPDDGYRVANIRTVNGQVDFDLLAGTLYLGGLRLELEDTITYRAQPDLLQPTPTDAPIQGARRDLVLLEAFEAPVTAVEDGELLDPALGGADTAGRMRRFARAHVISSVSATDCDSAWALIEKMMADNQAGSIGAEYRRVVDTRLTVTYTTDGVDDDLCDPPRAGGYLGAENQAIRVQLVSDRTFTWGYNNASPAYRVSLSGDRMRVTLITPPRDEYSLPVVGQVIEILPWGARLPNGEKIAALSGHLTRITAVDPSDDAANGAVTVTLASAVPTAGFENWRERDDAALLEEEGIFYFMHIWDRGADVGSEPAIAFTPNTPVTLGTTGIRVTFTGSDYVPEDAWVIGARPETPNQVLPWHLEDGAAPFAVHRYFAPLALIRWNASRSSAPTVLDCRPHFRPLTAQNGCCTFTVGDGRRSTGDYNDLALAIANVPDDAELCLLPGIHRADVALMGRKNLTISGCGRRSKVIPVTSNGSATITMERSTNIGLYNFDVVAVGGTGIEAFRVDGLHIEHVNVLARVVGIDVESCAGVMLYENVVRVLDNGDGDVGIYAQGDDVSIERCDVQLIPTGQPPRMPDDDDTPDDEIPDPTDPCADPDDFYLNLLYLVFYVDLVWVVSSLFKRKRQPYLALGGVQIGSGSENVLLRENSIVGGAGNGITLGSDIADIDVTPPEQTRDPAFGDVVFNHDFDMMSGEVVLDDQPAGNMTIFFERQPDGAVVNAAVDAQGRFVAQLPPGRYRVTVNRSSVGVAEVEPIGGGEYRIFLKQRDRDERPGRTDVNGDDLLAFIYDVMIERNLIAEMGQCGIGSPRFTTSDQAALAGMLRGTGRGDLQLMMVVYLLTGTITGFVVDLVITENEITRCLLFPPPLNSRENFTLDRALGGIALALCDGVLINENRIEDCGAGVERPICGVYLAFSVEATVRDNFVLNNGQDIGAFNELIDQIVPESDQLFGNFTMSQANPDDFEVAQSQPPIQMAGDNIQAQQRTAAAARTQTTGVNNAQIAQTNYAAYNQFSTTEAFVAAEQVPEVNFERGPRGGIVLPVALSANAFAGGVTRQLYQSPSLAENPQSASLNRGASLKRKSAALKGVTDAARGRYAARIDGNTVVQPYGRALFVGAAGTVSVTHNMLVSDVALPREIDASAGGITGVLASAFVLPMPTFAELDTQLISTIDYFASAVMVVNLAPGPYAAAALEDTVGRDKTQVAAQGQAVAASSLTSQPVAYGMPDGNVLFVSNQIRQGDAGDRMTMVSVVTLDDVNYSDNQIDVLNAENIMATTALLGVTVRALNNRLKEPFALTRRTSIPGTNFRLRRHSLIQFAFANGIMMSNQGHLCFLQIANSGQGVMANQTLFGDECGDVSSAKIPTFYEQWILIVLTMMVQSMTMLVDE